MRVGGKGLKVTCNNQDARKTSKVKPQAIEGSKTYSLVGERSYIKMSNEQTPGVD